MRKRKMLAIAFAVMLVMTAGVSLAASFTGKIWTNKPVWVIGIRTGYYCTAAQNTSSNSVNPGALAYSRGSNGAELARGSKSNNSAAVANSGFNQPASGYGEYYEQGGKAYQNFVAGAYN